MQPALISIAAVLLVGASPQDPPTPRQADLMIEAVGSQHSSAFSAAKVPGFEVKTSLYDRVPYFVSRKPGTARVRRNPGERVRLAADAKGAASYSVDNYLILEIRDGRRIQRLFVGFGEPLFYRGREVRQVGPSSFGQNAYTIDLSSWFPAGREIGVRAYALDYGGQGYVSDIYIIVDTLRPRLDAFISPGLFDPFDIPDDLQDEGI